MLEEQAQGYTGAFKIQVAGPWTLAATVEKPRGDKVLSDHGARRELGQALAEGVRGHVARRAPPAARRRPAGRAGRRAGAGRGAGRQGADRVRASAGTAPCTRPRPPTRSAGCSPRSPRRAPSRGCTPARPAPRSACCAAPVRAGLSVDLGQLTPPTTTCSPRRSRRASTWRSACVPVDRPGDRADREAGHRVGAALAGHARARPGRRSAPRWCSRRPAGSPARRTPGRAAPSACCAARRRATG